ncbi:MAG: hypothetical protein HQ546_05325, partial [Planctomycetes bacterium]|nr:hypothetical protein [Planctomycetota bacterium]
MTEKTLDQTGQLIELLTRQREVYQRLRELAKRQRRPIEDDQPEDLLRILGDRQRLIAEMNEINSALEPFRSRWDQLRVSISENQRMQVSDLVADVQQLLAEILDQDQGDCDALKERMVSTSGDAADAA